MRVYGSEHLYSPSVLIKISQVIFFVTCGSRKDSLSVLANLITYPRIRGAQFCFVVYEGLKFIQKLIIGNLNEPS